MKSALLGARGRDDELSLGVVERADHRNLSGHMIDAQKRDAQWFPPNKRGNALAAFPELDDQLCTWEPLSGEPSPDRLDALVWALTDLLLDRRPETKIVMPFYHGIRRNIPGQ